MSRRWLLILLFLFCQALQALTGELLPRLKAIPGVERVTQTPGDSLFHERYELAFRQPLDHRAPEQGSFLQRVYVSHADPAGPVLFETEGYAAGSARPRELTRIFRCNQIVVEHRYFGKSRPDSLLWQYLTLRQSADDLHAIASALRPLYPGKWISSGTSKGGQTTLIYRYFHPGDVDASVAYVAPVNLAREDPRLISFFRSVGTPECRSRIIEFQVSMLRAGERGVTLLEEYARTHKVTFPLGGRRTFEHMVLEYPFSFWQHGTSCAAIPPSSATPESLYAHLTRVVSYGLFTTEGIAYFAPFQYQAYTELGYYGYDITDLKPWLRADPAPDNSSLAPPDADLHYNCSTMQEVARWLQEKGERILYLYGETDPWGATAVELLGKTDAVKIVKPGGSHSTRIANLPPEQRELAISTLERWLGIRRFSDR